MKLISLQFDEVRGVFIGIVKRGKKNFTIREIPMDDPRLADLTKVVQKYLEGAIIDEKSKDSADDGGTADKDDDRPERKDTGDTK